MKEELFDFERYIELSDKLLEVLVKENCTTIQAIRSLTIAFGQLAMSANLPDEILDTISKDVKSTRDILKEANNDNE
jgi:hypothetical protein